MPNETFVQGWDQDIVALLRFHGASSVGKRKTLMQEAADEIERLRSLVGDDAKGDQNAR